jgi:hypothetical protein
MNFLHSSVSISSACLIFTLIRTCDGDCDGRLALTKSIESHLTNDTLVASHLCVTLPIPTAGGHHLFPPKLSAVEKHVKAVERQRQQVCRRGFAPS